MRRIVLLVALAAMACRDTPTTPAPTITIVGLAISPGTDFLVAGASETFTANATRSDGTIQLVSASWNSNNPAILTIDGFGVARAIQNGDAIISAAALGWTATRQIQVAANYSGTWSGNYQIGTCIDSGQMSACRDGLAGSTRTLQLVVTQAQRSISGTLIFGGFNGPISGTVQLDGSLIVNDATFSVPLVGAVGFLRMSNWLTSQQTSTRMVGSFVQTLSISNLTGTSRGSATIISVTR